MWSILACALLSAPQGAKHPADEEKPGPSAASAAAQAAVSADGLSATLQLLNSDRAPVDMFHPDHQPNAQGIRPALPPPALGGAVNLLMESAPSHLNYALANMGVIRRVLNEVHAFLMQQDWVSLDLRPQLARSVVSEDLLILSPEHAHAYPRARALTYRRSAAGAEQAASEELLHVVFGSVRESGAEFEVAPLSSSSPLDGTLRVQKAHVRARIPGGAITFELHPGVLWHPAPGFERHALDARDVAFSFEIYANPKVHCDERRGQFQRVAACEVLDPLRVRFLVVEPHFQTLETLGEMVLLPAHLYDLTDPDHPRHAADADQAARALEINENVHNRNWVGLGPYRVAAMDDSLIEARRFEGYFDPKDGGFLDIIRWRYLPDDQAFTALEAGELDFCDRVNSERFFGAATQNQTFAARYYRGCAFQGLYNFIAWNLRRPQFQDARVRRALAHGFDSKGFLAGYYRGLGQAVTGPFPRFSPAYDTGPPVLELDSERASELLAQAGWYDRDGDGFVDLDGERLAFDLIMQAGNEASLKSGLVLQEGLRKAGVECRFVPLDLASFRDRYRNRDFDAASLAWVPDVETDPEPNWHSRWSGENVRGSNAVGLADSEVDRLIDAGQREFDTSRRMQIWQALHRRIAELQPCLFQHNVPRKFVLNRAIRGHQTSRMDPGYVIRRWYYPLGTPGTRPLPKG